LIGSLPATEPFYAIQAKRRFPLTRKSRDDRITLAGVKIHPRIGVTPEERSNPQECEADLTIWGDFEAAAATDSIDKSVDYCRVLDEARTVVEAQEYVLVETLAYRIARTLLQKFPITRINVRIRKRPAVLIDKIDFVEVEVEEA
jgi:7,8-dihydroneopterin aldolase/epimerase/oxygenase